MTKPKLTLKLDVNTDIQNCLTFVKHNLKSSPKYINWFLPDELINSLKGKMSGAKSRRIMRLYALHAFEYKSREISGNVKKTRQEWKKVESRYFKLVGKIFKNHPWPKGKYTGFASIFMMYPRSIRDKMFFFPGIIYSKGTPPAKVVIGHEMLHFMFFDYINKKYGLKTNSKIKGKEKDYLWKISEVFNSVIESWRPYYRIFKFKTPPYTGKNIYRKMRRQWVQNPNVDKLLDKWLK